MRDNKRLILIADGEERIVNVLQDYLSALGYSVLCAGDGQEALGVFQANRLEIDMILLDLLLPGLDGISVLNQIRETSLVPVIFLTAKGEEYDQIRAFRAGADDYITKPFSQSVLVLRIEAVMQRLGKAEVRPLVVGNIAVDQVRRLATVNGERMELTRREFDLLVYFLANEGRTLTREQLRDGVWGLDFGGAIRTIDTHVKQLRGKLGDYGDNLKTIYRVGYQFQLPVEANK